MKPLAFTHMVQHVNWPRCLLPSKTLWEWDRRQTSFEYGRNLTGLERLPLDLAFIWNVYVLCFSESLEAARSLLPCMTL